MALSQRQKGKHGEQEAARLMSDIWPRCMSVRAGGETMTTPGRDLLNTPRFCVQVKTRNTISPVQALLEATRAAELHEIPIALCRRTVAGHTQPWTVTLSVNDFKRLVLAKLYELR